MTVLAENPEQLRLTGPTVADAVYARARLLLSLRRDRSRDYETLALLANYQDHRKYDSVLDRLELFCCSYCLRLKSSDESTATVEDSDVCDSCLDSAYRDCYLCEGYVQYANLSFISSRGEYACSDHVRISWCGECDEYYDNYDDNTHDHDDDGPEPRCGCEASNQQFELAGIRNDTRVDVTLPAGEIDDVGMDAIQTLIFQTHYEQLRRSYLIDILDEVGTAWQAKLGNFPKRLARAVYKKHHIVLSDYTLSLVGNLARTHSSEESVYHIELTRDLNMPREEFYNGDSCWWDGYYLSMCMFKANHGIGLRTWSHSGNLNGRAWVMPVCKQGDAWRASKIEEANGYIVFNGYGVVEGYAGARVLAFLLGFTYRKKHLYISDSMYINGQKCILVANAQMVESDQSEIRVETHEVHH